ncbi:hypothetical protein, partial [Burkholderia cenocepacia]|uniref:hypothetical protein n=1 Tax=Burkholderia cenocepacia TaxID=95486 RepID=UPI002012438D
IVFGTLHFGGSPVGELVLETRFSRIPREPPPSTFNYARDIAQNIYNKQRTNFTSSKDSFS